MTTNDPSMRPVASNRRYARSVGPISADAAQAEPTSERIYSESVGAVPLDTLPEPPRPAPKPEKKKPTVTLSATVEHRGRLITITVADVTVDRFCDLLDASQYASPAPLALAAAPVATADDLPDGWKLCKKHGAPMRPRNKQNEHWHSHNVGTAELPLWCKGYRGGDSPGYEVE